MDLIEILNTFKDVTFPEPADFDKSQMSETEHVICEKQHAHYVNRLKLIEENKKVLYNMN